VLPIAQPEFKGKIGLRTSESVLDFPAEVKAPKGAPNILLIMPDDVGFGATAPFGGPVPTPALERIANAGLRYNQFHTTALCSPTRAGYTYFEEVEHAGVRFFRYNDGFLHEKVMLIDEDVATVGTSNFDNRSFRLNFEITCIIKDRFFASEIEKMFLEDLTHL